VSDSKTKLKNLIYGRIVDEFEAILDYAQVACPDPDIFKVLRSRILREGNDCIRDIHSRLRDYDVEYIPPGEEVIEIKQ
jgi:hypothetical protein